MGKSNLTLMQKADLALADLQNGGHLNPEQTDRFIRKILSEPTILRASRAVGMSAPQRKINKIGFGSRILHAGKSSVALTQAQRSKPDLGQIELNTKEVIAEVRIPYDVLEDNIEGGNINAQAGDSAGGMMGTIVELIAERVAVDLEELALLGDKASSDPFLALTDGWLKTADENIVQIASGEIIKMDNALALTNAIPSKYLRQRNTFKFFADPTTDFNLRKEVQSRSTALGDNFLVNYNEFPIMGSQVQMAGNLPLNNMFYTNPFNLLFGIQRQITLEYDKDITKREFIIVVTARVDFQIEEKEAVSKIVIGD